MLFLQFLFLADHPKEKRKEIFYLRHSDHDRKDGGVKGVYLAVDNKNGGQGGKKGISVTEMFGSGLKIINLKFSSRITPFVFLFLFSSFFLYR